MSSTYDPREARYRDNEAPFYEESFSAYQRRCEEDWLRTLPRAKRLLDLGCGTQRFRALTTARAASVVGVDISRVSLALGRDSGGGLPVLASVIAVPCRSGAFDVVLAVQVMEHLRGPDDDQRFLDECARLVAPGGEIRLTVYNLTLVDRLRGARAGESVAHRYRRFQPADVRAAVFRSAPPGSKVRIEAQGLFLRRGTAWLQRAAPIERWVSRVPGRWWFASFIAVTVSVP